MKWNFFTSCLKNSWFVFRSTLRVFISSCFRFFLFCFLHVFIASSFYFFLFPFLHVFIFACSRFFLFLFLLVFVFPDAFIVDYICSLHCFFIVCVVTASTSAFFPLRRFLPYSASCFYQGFSRAASSAFKVAGLPTEIWNTDSAHLFVWITQCLANIG